MCQDGGLGCSTVSIRRPHPVNGELRQMTVNSCLYPLFACDGCEVETIEGLRAPSGDEHLLSQRLAASGGSACGYCSAGLIMNMHSLLAKRGANGVTMADVEREFGGNICRCSGYRPVLESFRSLAVDFSQTEDDSKDLEAMRKFYSEFPRTIECQVENKTLTDDSIRWHRPTDLNTVFSILSEIGDEKYILLGGNTEHGIYRRCADVKVFIEVNYVAELKKSVEAEDSLSIGGGFTISEMIDFMKANSSKEGYEYFQQLVEHMEQIGSASDRDVREFLDGVGVCKS